MATSVKLSAQAPPPSCLCSGGTATFPHSSSLSLKRTCQLQQTTIKIPHNGLAMRKAERQKRLYNHGLFLVRSLNQDSTFNSLSPSDTIKQFYKCINEKNLRNLSDYISKDCVFDDCSFSKPFEGKKEIMNFYEHLIRGMGRNMKFNIGNVCEGEDLTVGVNWYIEWKGKQVPFTRGCSFFQCSKDSISLLGKRKS